MLFHHPIHMGYQLKNGHFQRHYLNQRILLLLFLLWLAFLHPLDQLSVPPLALLLVLVLVPVHPLALARFVLLQPPLLAYRQFLTLVLCTWPLLTLVSLYL